MTKIEKQILKLFLTTRDIYYKYNYILRDNTNQIINIIISQIDNYYTLNDKEEIQQQDFIDVLKYTKVDTSIIEYINLIYNTNTEDIDSIIYYINNKHILQEIQKQTTRQLDSNEFNLDVIESLWENKDEHADDTEPAETRLDTLTAGRVGFRFQLGGLREGLGDVCAGDTGLIFARVETGKTGFVIDSSVGFIHQGAKVCHFNNEDPLARVLERYYIRNFEVPKEEIYSCIEQYSDQFQEEIGDSLKLYDAGDLSVNDIEKIIKKEEPDIVFIDQTDNLASEKSVQIFDELYYQIRAFAKKYNCIMLSCTQAGGGAYGALGMSNIYNSQVVKQAHTDFIIGIGTPGDNMYNTENIRVITCPKNKLTSNTRVNFNATYNPILMRYEQT